MRGGAILGEGGHGITYNLCKDDKVSFCNELEKQPIKQIILYKVDGMETLSDKNTIRQFIDFLHTKKDHIAKTFKPAGIFVSTTKQEFEREIESGKQIIELYGKHADKYLTIAPLTGFQSYKLFGAIFEGSVTTYAIFGTKCNNKYEIILPKLLKDILQSIIILQEKDVFHNDIKLDNIVKCSDRYKLIDWGETTKIDRMVKPGSLITTSPIRWYCYDWRLIKLMCVELLPWRARQLQKAATESDLFKEIIAKIKKEFYEVTSHDLSKDELFKKYKNSFDLFQLGMTLVYAIYDKPNYYKQYIPIIKYLTSLTDPPANAKEAMNHIKILLK
jgi:serine/threonine protein kinase